MKTKVISKHPKSRKTPSELPGFLVKHIDDNSVGILIRQDDHHSDFWHVFSSKGIVTWYKPKCEILT